MLYGCAKMKTSCLIGNIALVSAAPSDIVLHLARIMSRTGAKATPVACRRNKN